VPFASNEPEYDLASLFDHELAVNRYITPAVFRLARTRKDWANGRRSLAVRFVPAVEATPVQTSVNLTWNLRGIEPESRYNDLRGELRKLSKTLNDTQLTENAALGVAFALVAVLSPDDEITEVVQVGGRGDYYLNRRRDEMIEVSGVGKGDLTERFAGKTKQVLANAALTRAFVCIIGFDPAAARLERVR
jgi:hypothetical protein